MKHHSSDPSKGCGYAILYYYLKSPRYNILRDTNTSIQSSIAHLHAVSLQPALHSTTCLRDVESVNDLPAQVGYQTKIPKLQLVYSLFSYTTYNKIALTLATVARVLAGWTFHNCRRRVEIKGTGLLQRHRYIRGVRGAFVFTLLRCVGEFRT